MRVEILTCGTELLTGAAVDTNSAYLSTELTRLGALPSRHTSVADDLPEFIAALREACGRSEVLIVTGGLGPTLDDLTREAFAQLAGAPLEMNAEALASIEAFFSKLGRPMVESNRVQALFPRGAGMLLNHWGTAPGLRLRVGQTTLFALPGVPREMREMFAAYVAPYVVEQVGPAGIALRIVRTYGAGESNVAEQIADLMRSGRNPAVGTTASEGVITVRIVAQAPTAAEAARMADADQAAVTTRLGKLVYGLGEDTLATAVARQLLQRQLTLATAESCTGGLIAKQLTDVPGSSAFYLSGHITYSNAAKTAELGVDETLLARHGAVSAEVARAMAEGCRIIANADYALSCTGIAGPSGGTPEKPVGLVYLGLASRDGSAVHEQRYSERLNREAIRDRAAKTALNMLRLKLTETIIR
jgi:nicotinamide-nucleotide amidase